jgi:acyl-CoA dehydrogenase
VVVLEEMLAVGAPVGAHWIGDRQSGPLILRLGTEEQRRRILPGIARGELAFCIGLSEPDSGSDLASLRTRCERVPGGWLLNGRKIWTTFAHQSDYMIALVRTAPAPEGGPRHAGCRSSWWTCGCRASHPPHPRPGGRGKLQRSHLRRRAAARGRPAGRGGRRLGPGHLGAGLRALRTGPLPVQLSALAEAWAPGAGQRGGGGAAGRRLATLRQMSLSVGGMLERGEDPAVEARW